MGDLVAPAPKLRVQIVDIDKGACGKERVPQVLNLAFDFSLLVPPPRCTRPRREVIVAGELEQAGMKPNRRALPFEHGTAQIVVHQGAGSALKSVEGFDMAAEKTLERLVEREERRGAREYESTMTKPDSGRTPWPMRIDPKAPQSTCASSPINVVKRR